MHGRTWHWHGRSGARTEEQVEWTAEYPGIEEEQEEQLERLHEELKQSKYQPQPVREKLIPKSRAAGEVSQTGHTGSIRSSMSASITKSAGADLRAAIR